MGLRLKRETLVVVIVTTLLLLTVGIGFAADWPGSDSPDDITDGREVLVRSVARQDMDMVAMDSGLVVAWASDVVASGIVTRARVGTSWQPSQLISQLPTWAPNIGVGDDGFVGVWVKGADPEDSDGVRSLVSYDTLKGIQTIATGLYGQISPNLAINSAGDHVVFSAASHATEFLSGDLYYAFRSDPTSGWASPVLIVGSTQVVPDAVSGGIFNPQIAVESGTGTIHVVWQQKEIDTSSDYESVWHILGARTAGGQISWGAPERLSPVSQRYAVLPALSVGDAGDIHVTWTELIGQGTYLPDAQYIYYQRLGVGTPVTLNSLPIHVNINFPNWTVSSLSVHAETVCVAWHGYYGPQGQNYEEIFFRCSADNGMSWLQTAQVSDTPEQGSVFPRLVVDQVGRVHVAWVEYEKTQGAATSVPLGIFYRSGNPVHSVFLPVVLKSR